MEMPADEWRERFVSKLKPYDRVMISADIRRPGNLKIPATIMEIYTNDEYGHTFVTFVVVTDERKTVSGLTRKHLNKCLCQ
jgi:hypothetical protein